MGQHHAASTRRRSRRLGAPDQADQGRREITGREPVIDRGRRAAPVRRVQAPAATASAARIGAGITAAAAITRTKARLWRTMPSGLLAIGSPKTMMPPAMADTLAPALVRVITGTASPT